jgi:hypothetical protein
MYRHFLFLVWVVWVWIFLPTDDEAETWFEKQTGSGSGRVENRHIIL